MKAGLLLALLLSLQGCALTVSHPRALAPLESFAPLAEDSRVWVEPGFEAYGARVAAALPEAIAKVEAAHYLPFARTPRVHVCGSMDCFRRYVLTPKLSAVVIPDNRLILSPNLDGREKHRLPALLTHELAHLHLGQRIGHYHPTLPVWFHEGWATLTAEGGGAEYASDEKTFEAIRTGRRINLALQDTPDRRHRAQASGLDIHTFYRQAMLLVGWLKAQDEARFRQLVLAVQDNADFGLAFSDVYGEAPATRLAGFFDGVLAATPVSDDLSILAAPARP
ncbi:MAG: hypothetical protein AB1418_05635 [Pseudomonadota bacterium]